MRRRFNWIKVSLLLTCLIILLVGSVFASESVNQALSNVDKNNKERISISFPEPLKIWEIYPEFDQEKWESTLVDRPHLKELLSGKVEVDDFTHSNFTGFSGVYTTTQIVGNAVPVLENSLNIMKDGEWQALGLVRNETINNIGNVIVVATLFAEDGTALTKVEGKALVDNIRPGEPAPFKIASNALSEKVSSIEWDVTYEPKSNAVRDLVINVYYELAYGQDMINQYVERGKVNGSYPYQLSAGVINVSDKELENVSLIVAWLTPEGTIYHLEETELTYTGIERSSLASFNDIIVENSVIGKNLTQYESIMWAVSK